MRSCPQCFTFRAEVPAMAGISHPHRQRRRQGDEWTINIHTHTCTQAPLRTWNQKGQTTCVTSETGWNGYCWLSPSKIRCPYHYRTHSPEEQTSKLEIPWWVLWWGNKGTSNPHLRGQGRLRGGRALHQKPKAQINQARWGARLENGGREKGEENSSNMTSKGHGKGKMAKMPPMIMWLPLLPLPLTLLWLEEIVLKEAP